MKTLKREFAGKLASAILTGVIAVGATGCTVKFADPVKEETKAESSSESSGSESESTASEESQETTKALASESVEYPTPGEFISHAELGLGKNITLPQITIDTEEIKAMNEQIMDDFYGFYSEDNDVENYYIGYGAYDTFEGIYSILIDYGYDSWGGFYKAYTFDCNGHVYSNEEVLALAGIDEQSFYETAREATVNYFSSLDAENTDGEPILIDGNANPDHECAEFIERDLSEADLNTDMVMFFFYNEGLCIGQEIMPFADPHDSFVTYSVSEGNMVPTF